MAIRMPRMKEFLFGFSLRTGSIIIASISLATGIIFILPALIYGFGAISETEERAQATFMTSGGLITPSAIRPETIKAYVGITIASCLIQAIVSGMLLVGVLKKIRCQMIPWIIVSVITFVLLLIALLYFAIMPLIAAANYHFMNNLQKFLNAHEFISVIVKFLFSLVVSAYTTCVVYNYFTEVREYQEVNKRQTQA